MERQLALRACALRVYSKIQSIEDALSPHASPTIPSPKRSGIQCREVRCCGPARHARLIFDGAHNAGNDAIANLQLLICLMFDSLLDEVLIPEPGDYYDDVVFPEENRCERWNKREELFNRIIASIKGNCDVVEGRVDEEDDGEDAENEWVRVSVHRSRQHLYLSSLAETRSTSTPKHGSKPFEELFKLITGIERTTPDDVVSSSAPVGPHASQPVYVLAYLRHLQTMDLVQDTTPIDVVSKPRL